jgi:hypothetical protein
MATLSGNKIKNTYQSLVKFSDNGNITVGAKQLTDGFGNNSPIFVSTTQIGIGVTPESGLNLHVYGDAKIGSNLTVIGNLVVEGSTTTVGTDTLTVKDPLIVLANNNTSTDAVDIGFYGKYTPSGTTLYSGLFREALTGKYRLFKDLQVEPTTTVNTSGTGYAQATLIAALEGNVTGNVTGNLTGNVTGNVTGNLTGNVTGGTISGTTGTFSGNVDIDGTLDVDDVISVEGSTFGRIEIGGASGGYIDLKAPNSDDYDFRIITSSGGNEITTATGDLIFNTAETLALTIDTSQDAIFEGEIILKDNKKIKLGTDNDLEIYHDGGNGFIKNTTGQLNITDSIIALRNQADNENMLYARENAQVELYYDNSIKLATTNTGITVTGTISGVLADGVTATTQSDGDNSTKVATTAYVDTAITGHDTLAEVLAGGNTTGGTDIAVSSGDDITFADDSKAIFGTDGDLEIYHYSITDQAQITINGELDIRANTLSLKSYAGETMLRASSNGTVRLYYDGVEKLQTTSTGISVSGTSSTFAGDLTVDTDTLFVDASEDSVGIGLTNPSDYSADELVISVPDDSGMTLVSGTTDTAYIRFADGTASADQTNFISHDHHTNTLTVFSQAKVSIGITEAEVAYFTDTNFYVDKSTTIDDTLTVNGNATFAGKITITQNSGDFILENTGGGHASLTTGSSKDLNISSASGTVYINNNTTFAGRVGVGTNNPAYRLDVSGTGGDNRIRLQETTDNTAVTFLEVENSDNASGSFGVGGSGRTDLLENRGFVNAQSGTDGLAIGTEGTDPIIFYTQGIATSNERMRIHSNGRVSMGSDTTIAAANNLTLTNASAAEIDINCTGGHNYRLESNSSDNFVITDKTAGANRFVIDSSGNVGIGTDSPARGLTIDKSNANAALEIIKNNTTNQIVYLGTGSSGGTDDPLLRMFHNTTENIRLYTTGDSWINGGNLGIGTTSPSRLLSISDGTGSGDPTDSRTKLYIDANTEAYMNFNVPTNSYTGIRYAIAGVNKAFMEFEDPNDILKIGTISSDAVVFTTNNTERMRITSGGEIQVGNAVGGSDTDTGTRINSTQMRQSSSGTGAHDFHDFYRGTEGSLVRVGNIRTTGTTTAYNTSSDYRLKENVVEITGALDRVSQLKPSRFNFIADADKTVDGFLAHEVQEIVPEAITGEKDGMRDEEYEVSPAVYEDVIHPAEEAVYETIEHPAVEEELDDEGNVIVEGKEAYIEEVLVTEAKEEWTEKVLVSEKVMGTREVPDYQGIDQSKLVPLLVGAIQEQQQLINDLKARIETLENN